MTLDDIYKSADEMQKSIRVPWKNPCDVCVFSKGDPQDIGKDMVKELRDAVKCGDMEFYCMHRKDARGQHRICAAANVMRKS